MTEMKRIVTNVDSGKTLELHLGDSLEVVLSGNPTAGYQWEISSFSADVLKPLGESVYDRSSDAVGSGGSFAFLFQTMAVGQTRLHLVYHRPFEKRRKPIKTFEIIVAVRKPEIPTNQLGDA